jgi:hypothetical protein
MDAYLMTNMKQKLALLKRQEFVSKQEVNLGSLLKEQLVSRNLEMSMFDEYAKLVMFSVDGVLPHSSSGKIMSPAEMMDVVVKPDQVVVLLPRLAGG